MFQIGDVVAYGATGVCTIDDICLTSLSRGGTKKQEYYILRPIATPTCLTYVSTANALLVGRMRPILSKDEIHAMLDSIRSNPLQWIDDAKLRAETFGEILAAGLTCDLLRLIGCLYLAKKACNSRGRRFSTADERLLSTAEKVVNDEFSYVLGIKPEQVTAYVADHLKQELQP